MSLRAPFDPVPVSDLDLTFPADVTHLMPPWDEIPDQYRDYNCPEWEYQFWSDRFNWGVQKVAVFTNRLDIDIEMAFRHLQCIMGSYQPSHEYKLAAVAYLTSLWYSKIVWDCAARRPGIPYQRTEP